jgi:hypothetical protein
MTALQGGIPDDPTFLKLTADLYDVSTAQIFREFNPRRDTFDFTIILMDDEFSKKRRVDFLIPARDFERPDAEDFILGVARIIVMNKVYDERLADRTELAKLGRLDKHGRIIKA